VGEKSLVYTPSIHSPFHSKKNKLNYMDRESVGGSLFTSDWVSLPSADPVPSNAASQLERINGQFTTEYSNFSSHCPGEQLRP
jgi:hypothetical protein